MIRRNTVILILLAIAVLVFAYFFQKQKKDAAAAATPTASSALVFPAADGAPTDIKLEGTAAGSSVELSRDASGKWVLISPMATAADQAGAEAAATQVGALKIITDTHLDLTVIGLDKPSYILTVTFSDGKKHTLNVGSATVIQTGYYTQLDGAATSIVDKPGLDALIGMLNNPPYAETLTPTASDTPTPLPATLTSTPGAAIPSVTAGTPVPGAGTQAPSSPSATATP